MSALSRRHLLLAYLLALLLVGPSAVYADDTPRPACAAISPRVFEIYLARGVSALPLTERERINVSHYLSARKDPNRSRIYLYRSRHAWEPEPNLSLIFPIRDCDHSCIGTAVLPKGDQFDLVDFSYRKNFIGEPSPGQVSMVDGFQERQSKSHIFMDVAENNFLAFFDFQKLPAGLPWNLETLKQAESIRSSMSILRVSDRPKNYASCFKNLFGVEGLIP